MDLKDDRTTLNNTHDLLVDSRKGYLKAAERAEDPQVKALLMELSAGRMQLIHDLYDLRVQVDTDATDRDGGTVKGDLHRAWMDLRDSLSKSDNANVLRECERGEAYLLEHYSVDADDVSPRTFSLFRRQRMVVQENLDRIKQLARIYESAEQ